MPKPPIPKTVAAASEPALAAPMAEDKPLKFRAPESAVWHDLRPAKAATLAQQSIADAEAKRAKDELKTAVLASLQMQHVVVLAGSGTSLGNPVNGPSMWDLWDCCVNQNPGTGTTERIQRLEAKHVISTTGYPNGDQNIESLLSQCEAFLQIRADDNVSNFLKQSKETILAKCSAFLDPDNHDQLQAHRTFLHRLSRRRVRDSRVKVFTTNYDLCFESAAARQGLIAIDGFSFNQPREYDPRFFGYDIVRRSTTGDDLGNYVEGIFLLYKLHGSVNWERGEDGRVREMQSPKPDSACLIYPAKGKYQQSYIQPHLELMSQYLAALREPNTCLIITGFGFNDDHLSEPILAAIRNNPHLRVIVVNKSAEALAKSGGRFWRSFSDAALEGSDLWFIHANFDDFAALIPDLKSLTPAQRLANDVRKIAETK